MGAEEDLQAMINQTVELAISQKDAYFKEIEASNNILKIKDQSKGSNIFIKINIFINKK